MFDAIPMISVKWRKGSWSHKRLPRKADRYFGVDGARRREMWLPLLQLYAMPLPQRLMQFRLRLCFFLAVLRIEARILSAPEDAMLGLRTTHQLILFRPGVILLPCRQQRASFQISSRQPRRYHAPIDGFTGPSKRARKCFMAYFRGGFRRLLLDTSRDYRYNTPLPPLRGRYYSTTAGLASGRGRVYSRYFVLPEVLSRYDIAAPHW